MRYLKGKTKVSEDVIRNVMEPAGIKKEESETIHGKGKHESENINEKEQTGETMLQSKPFAFIIQAFHRFGGKYFSIVNCVDQI